MKIKSKGQSMSEYSICLAIILIAFVGIHIYVKRGLQGRYRDAVNQVTSVVSAKAQYEPYYAQSNSTVEMSGTTSRTISGMDNKKIINPGKVTRSLSFEPTTVESTNVEGAGLGGEKLEQGNKIVEAK